MKKYYHISFKENMAGLWIPKEVEGEYALNFPSELSEPAVPRICMSDTMEGCFAAIVPNIIDLLGRPLDFTVYSYTGAPDETPESLTANRLVFDAHVTRECWFLKPIHMVEECKITVLHDKENGWVQYQPFQDQEQAPRWIAFGMQIERKG